MGRPTCVICGDSVEDLGGFSELYCSDRCAKAARRPLLLSFKTTPGTAQATAKDTPGKDRDNTMRGFAAFTSQGGEDNG